MTFAITNTHGVVTEVDSLTSAESIASAYAGETRQWHGVFDQCGHLVAEFNGRLWGVR